MIVENRKKKVTWCNAAISWVFAVGACYLCSYAIDVHAKPEFRPFWYAFTVFVSEKVVMFFVFKYDVDSRLTKWFKTNHEKND